MPRMLNLSKIILSLFLLSGFLVLSQERYPNGQIKNEGVKWKGIYIEYYKNGNIKSKVDYSSLISRINSYKGYENGNPKDTSYLNSDSTSWKKFQYFENGQLKSKGTWLITQIEYIEKVPEKMSSSKYGRWVYFSPEGDSTVVTYDKNSNITSSGPYRYYYFNGQLKESGNYNAEGLRDGELIRYYKNGQLKYKGHFVNGVPKGKNIHYYENSNKDYEYIYRWKGNLSKLIHYYWDGSVKAVVTYNIWNLKKREFYYYNDGTIESKTKYRSKSRFMSYYYDEEERLIKTFEALSANSWIITKYDNEGNVLDVERHIDD